MRSVPVLEIGGTHVTAAWVDAERWRSVQGSRRRCPLDSAGTATAILSAITACVSELGVLDGCTLGVAIPGPFDYERGVGKFHGVAKFDALNGVDVGEALLAQLPSRPDRVRFVNDADAFALGEWLAGAAKGYDRVAAITIGTGIGSAFVEGGQIIADRPDVPPEGRVDLLRIDDSPLEDVVSRRAVLASYHRRGGSPGADVDGIAQGARSGDATAREVLDTAFQALGAALAPWLRRFGAQILVVGGSIAHSWDVIGPPLQAALADIDVLAARACNLQDAGEIGAAWHALSSEPDQ